MQYLERGFRMIRNQWARKIAEQLGEREKLEMVAEESAELAQAALKLTRAKGLSDNPTPITVDEAVQNFYEEFRDVLVAMRVVLSPSKWASLTDVDNSPKFKRWYERLEEAKK